MHGLSGSVLQHWWLNFWRLWAIWWPQTSSTGDDRACRGSPAVYLLRPVGASGCRMCAVPAV